MSVKIRVVGIRRGYSIDWLYRTGDRFKYSRFKVYVDHAVYVYQWAKKIHETNSLYGRRHRQWHGIHEGFGDAPWEIYDRLKEIGHDLPFEVWDRSVTVNVGPGGAYSLRLQHGCKSRHVCVRDDRDLFAVASRLPEGKHSIEDLDPYLWHPVYDRLQELGVEIPWLVPFPRLVEILAADTK